MLTLALTSVVTARTLVERKPLPEYNSMAELLSAAANEPQLSAISTLMAALTVGVGSTRHTYSCAVLPVDYAAAAVGGYSGTL